MPIFYPPAATGGGGGGSALEVLDEGVSLDSAVTSINVVGSAKATNVSHAVTLTIPGALSPDTLANRPAAADANKGGIFYATDVKLWYISTGSGWTTVTIDHGNGLTGLGDDDHPQYVLRSVLTTRGDLPYRGASDWARLGIGAAARFLRSDGTDPGWSLLLDADLGSGTPDSTKFLRGDRTWAVPTVAGDKLGLTPTTVKTANYSAAVGDFVPADLATTGSFTITLPTAPADGSVIAAKIIAKGDDERVLTLAAGGSDVINVAGGATTATLMRKNQSVVLQYKASSAIWYSIASVETFLDPMVAKTANYTALTSDSVILCDATTGAAVNFTVTLYTPVGNRGRRLTVKKTDADVANGTDGAITIDTPGSETIDGAAQLVLTTQYQAVTIESDGTNWHLI